VLVAAFDTVRAAKAQNFAGSNRGKLDLSSILHNAPPVSTGCAQRGNGFELRLRWVRVQSLGTLSSS
jgi:hypothetical protein